MLPDEITGFEWDEGNIDKNWILHQVSNSESEEIFFNKPLIISLAKYLEKEARHFALGITDAGRKLALVYTIRGNKIRVISARDMSRKEREVFDAKE